MKVAISGVSSTGKSTLAKAVAERLKVPLLWEQDCLDAGFAYGDSLGWEWSTRFMPDFNRRDVAMFERGFLNCVYEFDARHTTYITDAAPTNTLMYMVSLMPEFEVGEFEERFDKQASYGATFDLIWYLPYGLLPVVDDGRRITNQRLLLMQDFVLRGINDKYQDLFNINELYETNLEKRINYVMKGWSDDQR